MTVALELSTELYLAAGGQAVARAPDGRVVFVEGAAPEERVVAVITKDNPRFLRARVERVVEASDDRVEPKCPHFTKCGGCSLQHVSTQAQLRSKVDALRTTLRKIGGTEAGRVLPPWSGPAYGYRSRARWAVAGDGRLGYRQARGRRVEPVEACPVLFPALQTVLPALRVEGAAGRELNVVTDGQRVVAAWSERDVTPVDHPGVEWAQPVAAVAPGLEADGVRLHPSVFSQANPAGNRALRAQLAEWMQRWTPVSLAVELYAGHGNFSLVLAEHASTVRTFEASSDAVELAQRVVPEHVQAEHRTAEDALAGLDGVADVVLVDPPRAGLSAEVIRGIARVASRGIVYISCDPATFARDAGRLAAAGWRLDEVRLFDLYPQTAHAEVGGCFVLEPTG